MRRSAPEYGDKERAAKRKYYTDNHAAMLVKGAKYRAEHPEVYRSFILKKNFGITISEYDAMLSRQKGVCAICEKPNRYKDGRRLAVDHDHATGKVRGLLCGRCNKGIGLLQESIPTIERAIVYLRG
jgi:hypothetical protein